MYVKSVVSFCISNEKVVSEGETTFDNNV